MPRATRHRTTPESIRALSNLLRSSFFLAALILASPYHRDYTTGLEINNLIRWQDGAARDTFRVMRTRDQGACECDAYRPIIPGNSYFDLIREIECRGTGSGHSRRRRQFSFGFVLAPDRTLSNCCNYDSRDDWNLYKSRNFQLNLSHT